MHDAFANLRFGPFNSAYHAEATNAGFKEILITFLETSLLPQVEHPFESVSGSLTAVYNDQKNCGPNSCVRDIYQLSLSFHRPTGDDSIKVDLVFNSQSRTFLTRRNKPLYLWTVRRRENHLAQGRTIEALCARIAKHEPVEAICPLCSAMLLVHDSPSLFDVRCQGACFKYNYHRDPNDGQFLHGHFFRKEPGDA